MFKVNNKDIRTMPSSVFIVNFEHISPFPLLPARIFQTCLGSRAKYYYDLKIGPDTKT